MHTGENESHKGSRRRTEIKIANIDRLRGCKSDFHHIKIHFRSLGIKKISLRHFVTQENPISHVQAL